MIIRAASIISSLSKTDVTYMRGWHLLPRVSEINRKITQKYEDE